MNMNKTEKENYKLFSKNGLKNMKKAIILMEN